MNYQQLHSAPDGLKTFALIFDTGDEVLAGLGRFAKDNELSAAHFTAIGALQRVTTAWFNWETRQYETTEINEQVEVLMLAGDIATNAEDGKPAIHAHIAVGKRDGTAHGGHLKQGIVRPTLELILTEMPAHLRKTVHDESRLPLISIKLSDGNG